MLPPSDWSYRLSQIGAPGKNKGQTRDWRLLYLGSA